MLETITSLLGKKSLKMDIFLFPLDAFSHSSLCNIYIWLASGIVGDLNIENIYAEEFVVLSTAVYWDKSSHLNIEFPSAAAAVSRILH